jgi:hypothetical protein
MGLRIFHIGLEREALELECDDPAHATVFRRAWFECGCISDSLSLAITAGWFERRTDRTSAWLCPRCVLKNADNLQPNGKYRTNIAANA